MGLNDGKIINGGSARAKGERKSILVANTELEMEVRSRLTRILLRQSAMPRRLVVEKGYYLVDYDFKNIKDPARKNSEPSSTIRLMNYWGNP
jgi:hypothetical protein